MTKSTDVIIIGGGVIGCAIAYWLAKEHVRVIVIERDRVGSEASGAAAGILSVPRKSDHPSPYQTLVVASRALYETLSPQLKEETGIDVEYLRSGSLHLARSEKEVEAMKKRAAQDDLEWLSREEAQKREPALSPSIHGALYVPGDYQVNNPRLVQALAKGAILHGAEFIQGAPVIDITREGSRVTGVKTSYETINGGYVVISAGCWSGQIGALIGWAIPVEPARGQMVVTEALPPLIRHVIWSDDFYLVPRATGEILMGSTVEFVGFDKRVTLEGMSQLTQEGINIVPSLKGHSFVRAWAGLRPYSQTRSPILGPVPGLEQVAIASGHFRNGILLGLITGKLMKELIVDNRPSISLEPFYLEV